MSNQSIQPAKHRQPGAIGCGDAWAPCQPGTLASVQSPFEFERLSRRMALFQMGVIYLIGMLTAYASFLAFTTQRSLEIKLPPELSCEVARSLLPDYEDHTLAKRRVRESVAFHLANCASCDRYYQKFIGEEVDVVNRIESDSLDDCHCQANSSCQSSHCMVHSCDSGDSESDSQTANIGSNWPTSCKKEKNDHNDQIEPCIRP